MTRTALVAGGGIGGLSAAIGLRRSGWEVTVLERVTSLRPVGAGLVLQANGLRCLDALDLGAAVRDRGAEDTVGGTRRSDGRWLARIPAGAMDRILGTPAVGIHRAALQEILLGALPDGTVQTGAEVTGVTADGAVTYRAGDRTVRTVADLVVGADGIRSVVRRLLWPEAAAPVHVGVTAWRGTPRRGPVTSTWRSAGTGVPSSGWSRSSTAGCTGSPRSTPRPAGGPATNAPRCATGSAAGTIRSRR
jgi:2-polyprenyl-6-methoxyphenol hydroxylase-like FAD-dependent oxidoreductase